MSGSRTNGPVLRSLGPSIFCPRIVSGRQSWYAAVLRRLLYSGASFVSSGAQHSARPREWSGLRACWLAMGARPMGPCTLFVSNKTHTSFFLALSVVEQLSSLCLLALYTLATRTLQRILILCLSGTPQVVVPLLLGRGQVTIPTYIRE